ncbi:hypothetical protein [Cohaesibacter haloalkalitolerans]|uniref:hypothetical protein n=1 Tax=Cohaesibacter haloalkalitolerans TaxID=1162980 RepID=UPI000E64D937|nr:hypothetical protein [Cohaesibacter haloalkalitolerans]
MSRQLQSTIAAVILLFGLFAGTGQGSAIGPSNPVSCSEATVALASVAAEVPGCDKAMQHQTCTSDGVCSFLIIKAAVDSWAHLELPAPYPMGIADLVGAHTPPETPPPNFLL